MDPARTAALLEGSSTGSGLRGDGTNGVARTGRGAPVWAWAASQGATATANSTTIPADPPASATISERFMPPPCVADLWAT